MEQFKQQYNLECYYKFYIRYLMISKFNFCESKQIPHNISCNVSSQIPLNSNQVFLAWSTLSILANNTPINISKIWNKKSIIFSSKKNNKSALAYVMKIIYTLFVLRENVDYFQINANRNSLIRKFSVILKEFPITPEFEKFGVWSDKKKPMGDLYVKLDLSISDDRSYVVECFWRMWTFPVETY